MKHNNKLTNKMDLIISLNRFSKLTTDSINGALKFIQKGTRSGEYFFRFTKEIIPSGMAKYTIDGNIIQRYLVMGQCTRTFPWGFYTGNLVIYEKRTYGR